MKPQAPLRLSLKMVLIGLGLTGVCWWLLDLFSPFPRDTLRWMKLVLMQAHGALMMAALVVFGALLTQHILPSLGSREKRITGCTITGTFTLLAVSGWILYYIGSEGARDVASLVHIGAGLVMLTAYIVHAVYRR